MEYWRMWLVIVILLTIIEFATVNLVSIWFVVSWYYRVNRIFIYG